MFYAVPLLWLFVASTRGDGSLVLDPPFSLGSVAELRANFDNLVSFNDFQLARWALNSVIYSVGGVTLSLIARASRRATRWR